MARRPDPYLDGHPHGRLMRWRRRWANGRRPDSSGRWDDADHKAVLGYIWRRDDRKCGLCELPMTRAGAQIDHGVPKKFGRFDLNPARGGGVRAAAGTAWRSKEHGVDNLQAVHGYCNKAKGNNADPTTWRHPEMRPLPVAVGSAADEILWVPARP